MQENTSVCVSCGATNRLQASSKGQLPVCGKCKSPLPWLVQGSDLTFRSELDTSLPVLVDFWAAWCAPCRAVAPALEELSRELVGKIKVVKLNVDENPGTAGHFQVGSIPTLILFKDGVAAGTVVGALSKGALLQWLKPHLGRNS